MRRCCTRTCIDLPRVRTDPRELAAALLHFSTPCSAAHLDQRVPGFCTAQICVHPVSAVASAARVAAARSAASSPDAPPRARSLWTFAHEFPCAVLYDLTQCTHTFPHTVSIYASTTRWCAAYGGIERVGRPPRQHRHSRRVCQSMPLVIPLCRAAMHEPTQCTQHTQCVSHTWPPSSRARPRLRSARLEPPRRPLWPTLERPLLPCHPHLVSRACLCRHVILT